MATTTTSRELASLLMNAQSTGIAGIIQERVHSTNIGVEATSAFLQQLVQELEDAASEYLVPGVQALEHAQEVEMGTLITASSLSVRYVTEREAMLPLLSRFRAVFSTVLHFDAWSTAFLGLKTVALMASTRVLEAFGAQVDDDDVERELKWLLEIFVPAEEHELQWLMDLFAPQDTELAVQKADYLLRPTCEFVSVASQTHEHVRDAIYTKILPQMLTLVQRLGDEYSGDVRVADATLNELVATISTLLDARMAPAAANAFALLPLPAFIDGVEPLDSAKPAGVRKTKSSSDDDDDEYAAADGEEEGEESDNDEGDEEDDDPVSPLKFTNGDSTIYQCVATLCGWLTTRGRRTSASTVLPLMCQAIYLHDPEQHNTDTVATIVDSLVDCLRELELTALLDFEFANAMVESLRDVLLRVAKLTGDLRSTIYTELRAVMPRLESALQASAIDSKEMPAIKTMCSKVRQTLVEAFVAWLHNAGAEAFASHQADFLSETSTKLADPRVYGDVIHVVRKAADAADADVAAVVGTCTALLTRALAQLDRYSKTAAKNIVAAVTRVAVASGKFIAPFADDLALPLLSSIVDGSCKGKSLRARLEAVACILISSSADDAFEVQPWTMQQLDAHVWTTQFLGVLLDTAAGSEHAQTLSILATTVEASAPLRARVAAICAEKKHVVGPIFHDTLAQWPVYEEDIDSVILTLEILASLLRDSSFRSLVEPAKVASAVQTLAANAAGDNLDAVVAACKRVLASDAATSAAVAAVAQ